MKTLHTFGDLISASKSLRGRGGAAVHHNMLSRSNEMLHLHLSFSGVHFHNDLKWHHHYQETGSVQSHDTVEQRAVCCFPVLSVQLMKADIFHFKKKGS